MQAQVNLNQKRRLKKESEEVLGYKGAKRDEEKITPKQSKPILKEYNLVVLFRKCKDPRFFSIPFKLGHITFPKSMLDLCVSFNFIPLPAFEKLKLRPL